VNRPSIAEVARSRPSPVQLPIKIPNNAQYQSIDIDRTHAVNRQRDNNELVNHVSTYILPIQNI
jgi:hypothetical protein